MSSLFKVVEESGNIMPHAELAMDVDKLSDYHLINKYLNETTR